MSRDLLVAAFFDTPSLLAVRHGLGQGADGGATRVAGFAATRRPDTSPSGYGCVAIGATIVAGLLVVGIGYGLLSDGSSAAPLPVIDAAVATDCRRDAAWKDTLSSLGDDLMPRPELQRWYVRTLLDIPRDMARRGDASGGWLKPRCAPADLEAHRQGAQLAAMLSAAGANRDLALILDLPGPQAVAAAAGLSTCFEPVFTMDNIPHPSAVVPSAQTLASVVHWRPELVQARASRASGAAPAFVLEGDRLAAYGNEVERFDNRSLARLPDPGGFAGLGIRRILHVRSKCGAVAEADDLNPLFVACAAAGIEVRHIALEATDRLEPANAERISSNSHLWFWRAYGWNRPAGMVPTPVDDPDARYRSAPRPDQAITALHLLDGGLGRRAEAIDRLAPPPPARSSSSGGGSWSRSHSSSSG